MSGPSDGDFYERRGYPRPSPPPYSPPPVPYPATTQIPIQPAPQPRRRRRLPWILAGATLLVAAAATAVLLLLPRSRPLTVTFALLDPGGGSDCYGGDGGYSDVGPGMPVVVRDNDGRVIGTSELRDLGEPIPYPDEEPGSGLIMGCEWMAVVEDVPAGEDYYAVTVGDRGEQIYTGEQLDERGWKVELSLGP